MSSVIIALSGGVDSTTLLSWFLSQDYKVTCVSFDYGSKHNKFELSCAEQIYTHFSKIYEKQLVDHINIEMNSIFRKFNSSLLKHGGSIPEGYYTDKTMNETVVPARNIIFLSIMSGIAKSNNTPFIGIGIHQGDHAIYADCRTEFYNAMNEAIQIGTDKSVSIKAPFVDMTKAEIIRNGLQLRTPYWLTRTCYKQQETACGKCGACIERLEAFKANYTSDPIQYEESE